MPSLGMQQLGQRIESSRKYLKISRAKLLKLVVPSMSMTSYINLTRGAVIYDVDALHSLCKILNIPKEYVASVIADEYLNKINEKFGVDLRAKNEFNALVDLEKMFKRASKDRQALFLEFGRAILTEITLRAP